MGDHPQPPVDQALANLDAAFTLLEAFITAGVRHWVLCPGSRSGPLAVAIGCLERRSGVVLSTAIDERSAAFFALGHGRVTGVPAAVITTSGTAVANLLPAAVEADFGTVPLLLITADRPGRLRNCGANQTVNQESFLRDSVRRLLLADAAGLHRMDIHALCALATEAVGACLGGDRHPPGAVHLNVPLEEPLHGDPGLLPWRISPVDAVLPVPMGGDGPPAAPRDPTALAQLDPDGPGLIVAGPWRGRPQRWNGFVEALRGLQQRTGWPLLADALSGLRGHTKLDLIAGYDLLLTGERPDLQAAQVLRLGPVPASRRLQQFLGRCGGRQLVVSEAEPRSLDAVGSATGQESCGLQACWQHWQRIWPPGEPAAASSSLAVAWRQVDRRLQGWLDQQLLGAGCPATAEPNKPAAPFHEPSLVRRLAAWLPAGLPLVLANSSPVRDWESFMPPDGPMRPVLSFRGGSGIDGTLSLAFGVAEASGAAVLVSGDLALLHDSNGWLWRQRDGGRLAVLLIDNGGGGIFEQLPIRQSSPEPAVDFERLFAMPQAVDPLALAAAHGVPGREPGDSAALERDLRWALAQPVALLRLRCDRRVDAEQRRELRTMGAALTHRP
jgi:2-succinyl-5-enolpyruvyl-6-hydroxy-3-cyclohexene-1-carboxylate synthase